jgi:hypothetical protein
MWLPAITLADGCSDYWRETFRGVCGIRGKSSCDRRIMAIQTVARTSWSDAVAYQKRTTKTPKNQELRGLWLRRRRVRSFAAESTPGVGIGDKRMVDGCDGEAGGPHRTLQA